MGTSVVQDPGFWAIIVFGAILIATIISFTIICISGFRRSPDKMAMDLGVLFSGGNTPAPIKQ